MIETIGDVKALLENDGDLRGAGEVDKSQRMRELKEAERLLEAQLDGDRRDAEAIVLLARLASRMQQWDLAIVRWRRITRELSERRDEAFYQLAVAYRKTGSLTRAHGALDQIRDKAMAQKVSKERREVAARETEAAARVVGNKATELLVEKEAQSAALSLLESFLTLRNYKKHVAECIMQVATAIESNKSTRRRLTGLLSRIKKQVPQKATNTGNFVFFCGFGWSGSGALFDYYTQSDIAALPFARSEIPAFERPSQWSAQRVLNHIPKDRAAARRALVSFIFQSVLGIGGSMSLETDQSMRRSIINYLDGDSNSTGAVAIASISLFHEALDAANVGRMADVECAFRRFFDHLLEVNTPNGKIGMMTNCIHAYRVGLVRLVSAAKAVVVFRDPRDQYVSQVYERGETDQVACDRFIRNFKAHRARYERELKLLPDCNVVIPVQFEAFVLSSDVRDDVAKKLGVPIESIKESKYQPSDSIKNVGIHRSFPRVGEIRKIERELGEFIFDGEER